MTDLEICWAEVLGKQYIIAVIPWIAVQVGCCLHSSTLHCWFSFQFASYQLNLQIMCSKPFQIIGTIAATVY